MLKNCYFHQVTFPVTMWLFLKNIFRSREFFASLFVCFVFLLIYSKQQPIGPQALIKFLKLSRAVSSQEL